MLQFMVAGLTDGASRLCGPTPSAEGPRADRSCNCESATICDLATASPAFVPEIVYVVIRSSIDFDIALRAGRRTQEARGPRSRTVWSSMVM